MSWQTAAAVATVVGTAASVAGTAASMAGARGRGAMNADAFTAQGNSLRRDAAAKRDQAAEVELQATMEENQRLAAYQQMMAANVADLPTRGVTDSGSFDAIMRHNQDAAATDLMSVRYMGSAKSKRLLASADAADEAANIYYKGGTAAVAQGETESAANLARGGWQLASSMPNLVSSFKTISSAFDGGGVSIRRVSSTPTSWDAAMASRGQNTV